MTQVLLGVRYVRVPENQADSRTSTAEQIMSDILDQVDWHTA